MEVADLSKIELPDMMDLDPSMFELLQNKESKIKESIKESLKEIKFSFTNFQIKSDNEQQRISLSGKVKYPKSYKDWVETEI